FDHSAVVDGSGDTVWFSSTRAGGPLGSSDWYMTYRDPVTGTYSPAVPIAELCTTDWDSNGWHAGATGRFYVSQFVGVTSSLFRLCSRTNIVWVEKCLISLAIPRVQIFPPKVWWDRIWLASILVPTATLEFYSWYGWPAGGFSLLFASTSLGPDIPASLIIPGSEGTVILGGSPISVLLNFHPPGSQAGLAAFTLAVPPNPMLIGQSLHFQDVGLDLGTNALRVSEAGSITLTN
ncbi:MAG TPA: hypothetical protein VFZ65_12225, partial [Planctomycetota bacterium]|nr:hypothetical protein [Planctomycetota bacterium]